MKPLSQLDIFDTSSPYSDDKTSKQAALSMRHHIQRLERRVLDELWSPFGFTAEELEEATGLSGNTVRPRLVALRAKGLVVKTDEVRPTRSGRTAAVWKRT